MTRDLSTTVEDAARYERDHADEQPRRAATGNEDVPSWREIARDDA